MRFAKITVLLALVVAATIPFYGAAKASTSSASNTSSVPHYNHIFVLVEENHGFGSIIGNPYAPTFNQLASTYGLATHYFGAIHPSEGNYVALTGANSYGIADDNPYYTHTIHNPSIVDQLEGAGLSWKGYFQSMPYAGFKGVCYPVNCTGPLYASKHNGFLNFVLVQKNPSELQKLVPITRLTTDLQNGNVPNYSFIAPDECHDMHGAPPFCVSPGKPGSPTDNIIVKKGDDYAKGIVNQIMSSSTWSQGNNAIIITWDEGNNKGGCCDALPGGGHVVTIVITNHGPRGIQDGTYYNHYSLVATIEQVFGLSCLQYTCDTAKVKPMTPLFATN